MPKKTFTLYLGKPDVEQFNDLLSANALERANEPTTRIINSENFGDGARVYIFVGTDSPPKWLNDLRREFPFDGQILTKSSSALLLFRSAGRLFVSTFAHGWMYLDEENLEGSFGLRVAINALDDSKLKRLERANLGDALRGVSLSPFQRDFNSFGIDDALDLVRKISGKARNDSTAETIMGSHSLKVSGEFSLFDLPGIAAEALNYFDSTDYRETKFRVLDFVEPITDRRLSATLDGLAVQSIRDEQNDFELGLPASYEDEGVAYQFSGPRLRGRYSDLLLRNYTSAMGDRLEAISIETLRDHKIIASYEDDNQPDQKWSIRTALVGSIAYEGGRYAINEGEWYRIDDAFRQSIEESFLGLVEVWAEPPTPLRKIYDEQGNGHYQSEFSYNTEIAEECGYILLDHTLVEVPGVQRSGFEPCDLLDIDGKRFIHVKKNSRRSSVLSHFFKQGANSAQNFSKFTSSWESLWELVRASHGNEVAERLQQAAQDRERQWTIEFRIADTPRANGEFNIPFFSKISLRDEVINLSAMNYRVALRFIGLEPENI